MQSLRDHGIAACIFSSTCATYGVPQRLPLTEDHPQQPINPYGASKLMVERMLGDFDAAHGLRSISLRYFNAAGADPLARIGERHEPETHLIPLALQGLWGSFFSRRYGPAMRVLSSIRPWRRVTLVAGAVVPPEEASPARLKVLVGALRGDVC